jgi:hypothetical protein
MKVALAPTPNEVFPGDTPGPKQPPLRQTAALTGLH